MPYASPLIDLQRGGAITVSGSTIDVRAIGTGIRYDSTGAISALSVIGNSLTIFQPADPKSALQPRAIVGSRAEAPLSQDIVVADNAGTVARPRPAALGFEQLAVAADRWGKFHGFVSAIPNGQDDPAMVSTGFIGIRGWAADLENAPVAELKQALAHSGIDFASAEGRVLASNRWARRHKDANGKPYQAGWPNFEQNGRMQGVICFKRGAQAITYFESDIGNVSGLMERIAKLSRWCASRQRAYQACLPTFEIGSNGQLGAIMLRSDDASPIERVGQEELHGWLADAE